MSRFRTVRLVALGLAVVASTLLQSVAAPAEPVPGHPVSLKACQNIRAGTFNNMLMNGPFTLEVYRAQAAIFHSVPLRTAVPDVYMSRSWSIIDYRENQPPGDGTYLAFHCNGDLALRHQNGSLIWHTNTAGRGATRVSLTSTGNLAMYTANNALVWQSGSGPSAMATNSLLRSNTRLISITNAPWTPVQTLAMQTDGNLVYRVGGRLQGQSGTHVPGSYAGLTTKAQLVVISPAGKVLWASGPSGSSASVFTLDTGWITQYEPTYKFLWSFSSPSA